ncbi:flagellar hook protein FlgE [Bartonella ancashensis]|uniref:Flagellar hook protein FlgE n=1 Tax=Bartonella ancashensis TaxID=1318743 RepID=A0A0M4L763_9HYPH|nr:flagellar hook protein FlgE [Bartonella ancashensis]ALE02950.1 Flagellar hook protein FlgE [Bartonella ancashensis]
MSIYGMMHSGISGMNAQGKRLAGVAENVSNAGTVGYKRTNVQFSNYVTPSGDYAYIPGGVKSHVGHDISLSGPARATGRSGDAMIDGNGFFRVEDENGNEFLTRAGSFVRDKDGYLRNTAGYYLLNDEGERIQIKGGPTDLFDPEVTTMIDFKANFDASAEALGDGDIDPNDPKSYNQKKSVTVYDSQGKKVQVDFYMRKTADNKWTVDAYHGDNKVGTTDFNFDKEGNLIEPISDFKLILPENDGGDPPGTFEVVVDFGGVGDASLVTQKGNSYAFEAEANGMEAGAFDDFSFGKNGEIQVKYTNRQTRVIGHVGVTTVTSPESLTVLSGTVFQTNIYTGAKMQGRPNDGVFGSLHSGYLEDSNVDMSEELTDMIESQRNYTANSKVFQTGSELMDVIVNLKR